MSFGHERFQFQYWCSCLIPIMNPTDYQIALSWVVAMPQEIAALVLEFDGHALPAAIYLLACMAVRKPRLNLFDHESQILASESKKSDYAHLVNWAVDHAAVVYHISNDALYSHNSLPLKRNEVTPS